MTRVEFLGSGRLLQRVANLHQRLQAPSCLYAEFAQRNVEENLGHPGGKGIDFKAEQAALDLREHMLCRPVVKTCRHALRQGRKECASATRGIQHARLSPIHAGLCRQVQ